MMSISTLVASISIFVAVAAIVAAACGYAGDVCAFVGVPAVAAAPILLLNAVVSVAVAPAVAPAPAPVAVSPAPAPAPAPVAVSPVASVPARSFDECDEALIELRAMRAEFEKRSKEANKVIKKAMAERGFRLFVYKEREIVRSIATYGLYSRKASRTGISKKHVFANSGISSKERVVNWHNKYNNIVKHSRIYKDGRKRLNERKAAGKARREAAMIAAWGEAI